MLSAQVINSRLHKVRVCEIALEIIQGYTNVRLEVLPTKFEAAVEGIQCETSTIRDPRLLLGEMTNGTL